MSIIGISSEWADLIDSLVPEILKLVITTWEEMSTPAPDDKEDKITFALCRELKKNRTARSLPFNIYTQLVELEPAAGEEMGRQDIVFVPVLGREDIYFCLESKRLNVVKGGKLRTYASEYVTLGMLRFVTGQYSKAVRHGGMLGYVLDGNVAGAIDNVKGNIQKHHVALCMAPPGELQSSIILISEPRARETHHQRVHETSLFRIHHLFMAAAGARAS